MGETNRAKWTNDMIKCLLESCIEEVNKVGRNGINLHKECWVTVGKKIEEAFGLKFTQKQMKNEYDYLRKKYSVWLYLKNKTGNIYNPETNTFNLTNEEWEEVYKGHPKARSLRTCPLPFPDLCSALFDGTSATGSRRWAPSSSYQRSGMSSSSYQSQALQLEDTTADDENDDDMFGQGSHFGASFSNFNEEVPNTPQSNPTPSEAGDRPKKKGKRNVSMTELKVDMSNLIKTFETRFSGSSGSTIDDCIERLNTIGLDRATDRRYLVAYSIFAESLLNRETWMKLPSDPELLKEWITIQGEKMGVL